MKIITVLGTRPEITKLSPLLPLLDQNTEHIVIHTGQHYDHNMDQVFFEQLNLTPPKYNLHIGQKGLSHAEQTAKMMIEIEKILKDEKPDLVLVFADPNTPMAAAITSSKLNIKTIHLEAGCRSFNKQMPEEINRIVCDHVSDYNFAPDNVAKNNLINEGIKENQIKVVGSTAIQAARRNAKLADEKTTIMQDNNLTTKEFILLTIHRAENTNDIARLTGMIDAINQIAEQKTIVFPIHPRTKKIVEENNIKISENVKIIPPQDYFNFLTLLKNAILVMSDSGGVQEEAAALDTPCLVLRNETEWTYLTDSGKNLLLTTNKEEILSKTTDLLNNKDKITQMQNIPIGRQANAAQKIFEEIKMLDETKETTDTTDTTTSAKATTTNTTNNTSNNNNTNNQETTNNIKSKESTSSTESKDSTNQAESPTLKDKVVVVTGGAGFVGSHLVDRIIKEEPKTVIVLSNFFLGNPKNLENAMKYPGFKLLRCDVTDYEPLENIFNEYDVDVVFNLAVIPLPTSLVMPEWTIRQNVEMTLNVCKLQRLGKFKTLIQYSSSEACGTAREIPMVEEYRLDPETPYAASKAATDHIALSYHHTFNLDVAVIRPYNQYGPRQNAKKYAGVIPLMVGRMKKGLPVYIFGDGEQTRDFLHVKDTADGTIEVYKSLKTRGKVTNLASGKEVKIKDIIFSIANQVGYPREQIQYKEERIGDVKRHLACTKRAKELFGWEQKIPWEQGLRDTVQWYLDRPEVFE